MAARAEIRTDGRDLLINTPYIVTLTSVKMNGDFFLDGKYDVLQWGRHFDSARET